MSKLVTVRFRTLQKKCPGVPPPCAIATTTTGVTPSPWGTVRILLLKTAPIQVRDATPNATLRSPAGTSFRKAIKSFTGVASQSFLAAFQVGKVPSTFFDGKR